MTTSGERRPRIFTMGHSDRSLKYFLDVLESSSIRLVADVRSNPASSRFPYFERHTLSSALERRGIAYRWFRPLGGLISDPVVGEELHLALDSLALRRYAAKLNTEAVTAVVSELMGLAASTVVVILCAEMDYRKCHRRLLSDKLQFMGARVVHILSATEAEEHSLHPDLVFSSSKLMYIPRQLQFFC